MQPKKVKGNIKFKQLEYKNNRGLVVKHFFVPIRLIQTSSKILPLTFVFRSIGDICAPRNVVRKKSKIERKS